MNFSRPSSVVFWILWHSLAVISIVQIPSQFKYGVPVWSLQADKLTFLIGLAISYFVCVVVLTIKTREKKRIRLIDLISTFLTIFGIFFLFLLLTDAHYSRAVLLLSLTLAGIFAFLSLTRTLALPSDLQPAATLRVSTCHSSSGRPPPPGVAFSRSCNSPSNCEGGCKSERRQGFGGADFNNKGRITY